MVIWQAAAGSLKQLGMNAADIGVAPVPLPSRCRPAARTITSMVAGINMAIFKNTKNMYAALQFVKFMTSTPEQESLNSTYGSLPTVSAAYSRPGVPHPGCDHVPEHPQLERRADAAGDRRKARLRPP